MIRLAFLLAPALLFVPALRHFLESGMATHMLVEYPLLVASGFAAASGSRARLPADASGLATLVFTSGVAAFWMIPTALDLALLSPAYAAAKYATLWLAGAALAQGWPRMSAGLRAFFLGNTGWMLATAGLLIAESEQRLCVNYRFDEQVVTGWGLVGAALAVLLVLPGCGFGIAVGSQPEAQ